MKKNVFILAAIATVALAACTKQEMTVAPDGQTKVFEASLEQTNSQKTTLTNANKVEWILGDQISFFDGSDNVLASAKSAGSQTTFEVTPTASGPWYALYPYNSAASISEGVITTVLPSEQTAVAGTFADNFNVAIALSNGSSLAFKNVLGYIKFNMGCDFIKSVTLEGNNSENLAGTVTLNYNAGAPSVASVTNGVKAITLAPASGNFTKGEDYYIAILPQTLSQGFKLSYSDIFGDTHVFSTDKSATVGRSKIINIHNVDGGVLVESTPIQFACAAVKTDLLAMGIGGTIVPGEICISEAMAVTYTTMSAKDPATSTATKSNGYTIDPWKGWTDPSAITSFDEFKYFTGLEREAGKFRTPILFAQCKNLTSVTLPYNITEIANYCFQNCITLPTIHFPKGLTSIYSRSFHNCKKLAGTDTEGTNTNVLDLPETVVTISTQAFFNCVKIGKLGVASNKIATIKAGAFQKCSSMTLTSRVFSSLSTLEHGAFSGCSKLASFNISNSQLTEIPDSAFYNCKAMTAFYTGTGNKLTTIGLVAFYGCESLETFTTSGNANKLITPNSCTTIKGYAFSHCYPLGSAGIVINEGVTTLGERVFRYDASSVNDGSSDSKKTEITLPSTLQTMSFGCFTGRYDSKNDNRMYIKSLTCKAITPPTVTNIDYKGNTSSTAACLAENSYTTIDHIYVPAGSVDDYKQAAVWSNYENVIEAIPAN